MADINTEDGPSLELVAHSGGIGELSEKSQGWIGYYRQASGISNFHGVGKGHSVAVEHFGLFELLYARLNRRKVLPIRYLPTDLPVIQTGGFST